MLKDTLTHGKEEPGIKPRTLGLKDDLLYLLSHTTADLYIQHNTVNWEAAMVSAVVLLQSALKERQK